MCVCVWGREYISISCLLSATLNYILTRLILFWRIWVRCEKCAAARADVERPVTPHFVFFVNSRTLLGCTNWLPMTGGLVCTPSVFLSGSIASYFCCFMLTWGCTLWWLIITIGRDILQIQEDEIPAVSMKHLEKALSRVRSSVQPSELVAYEAWNDQFGSKADDWVRRWPVHLQRLSHGTACYCRRFRNDILEIPIRSTPWSIEPL